MLATADPCRKCGRKDHPPNRCHSKTTYKKCKGKDHGTRFCTVAITTAGYNCTFCGKGTHSIENCKARKRFKRRTQIRATDLVTPSEASNVSWALTGQTTAPSGSSPPVTAIQMPQIVVPFPNMSISTPTANRSESTANGQWCWCEWHVESATWVTIITGANHMHNPNDPGWKQSLLSSRINCIHAPIGSQYVPLIGTMYRNSLSSTNNNYSSFQIFPRRSCEPQVQERACPTQTYACLAKHYSKQPIGAPRLNLVPTSPKLYKVAFHNVLVFLSWTPKSLQQLT